MSYIEWDHTRMPSAPCTQQRPSIAFSYSKSLAVDLKQPSLFGVYLVLFPIQVNISLCARWWWAFRSPQGLFSTCGTAVIKETRWWGERMTATHCYLLPFFRFSFVSNTASDKTCLAKIAFFSKCLLGGKKEQLLVTAKKRHLNPDFQK